MTKRFELVWTDTGEVLHDNETGLDKGIYSPDYRFHVRDMMNELAEEIEELKRDGFYWAQTAKARRKEIDKLRKDNTILKQERDYLLDVIDEVLPHSGSTTVYNRMKKVSDVK